MSDERQAILAIDQGTTSSRAIVFDKTGRILAQAQQAFPQLYPREGWVEHDPQAIWQTSLATAREAFNAAETAGAHVAALGITNQRETVILWDRASGEPLHNAIVWQDRRTAEACARLAADGHEPLITERTGLIIDPYFSATKLAWLLDHVPGARERAKRGELAAGTVDTWLIWQLTGGGAHLTDATNACRTSLYDIHRNCWDADLLDLFGVPDSILPEVHDSADAFGSTDPGLFGRAIPILGVAGDQQAAAIGQACFAPGNVKSTYGTGCFVIMNTGHEVLQSKNRLLSTICYRMKGETTYAVEGSIFIAGAAVQWLRDTMGVLASSAETAERAARARADAQTVMVPAFTGMGAPHWSPEARAAVFGMTRDTGPDELAMAALEGVIFQTHDLFAAMARDGLRPAALRIDGGMAANDWFVQRLADILDMTVERPAVLETTAFGAACLAGLQAGMFASLEDVAATWQGERVFTPDIAEAERTARLTRWQACVEAVLAVAKAEAAAR